MSSMRQLLRENVRSLIYYAGLTQAFSEYKGAKGRILMYHNISPQENDFVRGLDMTVAPQTFERHLKYLSEHFRIVPFSQLLAELQSGTLRDRTLALTFDDGYRDLYPVALPILQKYRATACVLLNPSVIGGHAKLWPNKIAYVVNKLGAPVVAAIREQWGDLALPDDADAQAIVGALNERQPVGDIVAFVDAACARHHITPPDEEDTRLYLDWDEIRSMMAAGIEFGNHTDTHVNLAMLPEEDQRREIVGAKDAIVTHLGGEAIPFAYPFGQEEHFTPVTRQIVEDSGHSCALEALAGPVFEGDSPYSLKRIDIREMAAPRFITTVHGVSLRQGLALARRS